jgi:hypothetical protein
MSTRTGAVKEAGIWRIGTWDEYQTPCLDELWSRKSGSLMFGLGRRVETGSCSSRLEQVLRKKPKPGLAQVFLHQALGAEIAISSSCKASCRANRCLYENLNSTPFARHPTRRVWPTLLTEILCRMSLHTYHWDWLTRSAIENLVMYIPTMSSSRTYWSDLLLSMQRWH